MKREMIDSLYMDIKELEDKVFSIGPYDEENYKLYSNKIEEIKKELVQVDDSREMDMQDIALISKITKLGMDFDDYRKGNGIDNDFLIGEQSAQISGDEKAKKYRMSIFADISNLMQELELVDIQRLMDLSSKWQQEKNGDLKYSMPEISEVEAMLANVYLKYQLDYAKINGTVPKGIITEIEESEEYKTKIKQKVLEYMHSHPDSSSTDKMELSEVLKENDINKIIKNKNMWRIIASKPIEIEEASKTTSTALTINENPPKKCLTVVIGGLFNSRSENKTVDIPLNNGIIKIPRRLRKRIMSASIPEGTEYISNEAFKDCKNMYAVSIPKSVRYIGNRAFYGCEKLSNFVMNCDINDVQIEDDAFEQASESLRRFNTGRIQRLAEGNSEWEYKVDVDSNPVDVNTQNKEIESTKKDSQQEEK